VSTGHRDPTGVASRIWAAPGRKEAGPATPERSLPGAAPAAPPRTLPEWVTLSEAAFLTGVDREALLEWTRTQRGAGDARLSRRMGPGFVMVRTRDLRASGLLASAAPARPPEAAEPVPEPVPRIAAAAPGEGAGRPSRRRGRLLRRAVAWGAVAAVAGVILSVTAPALFGYRSLIVLSGSMSPAIGTGDVVVERPVSPLELRVGDVVTFQDPDREGRAVTHRIRAIRVRGGVVDVTTRGDANGTVERWSVATSGMVGRVVYHVWKIGYLLVWLRSPLGRLLFLVVPAVGLVALELRRIWRAEPAPDEAPA
jgi:signal peptidase I